VRSTQQPSHGAALVQQVIAAFVGQQQMEESKRTETRVEIKRTARPDIPETSAHGAARSAPNIGKPLIVIDASLKDMKNRSVRRFYIVKIVRAMIMLKGGARCLRSLTSCMQFHVV
jgi:hypothetical protein